MIDLFVCAQIDAPDPPEWLDQQVLAQIQDLEDQTVKERIAAGKFRLPSYIDNRGKEYTDRILYHPTGESVSAFTNAIFFDKPVIDWATQNVMENVKDMRYTFTVPGRCRLGPHIDLTRNYTLIYLVQAGGQNPKTVFYKEKGHAEVIRPNGYHLDDYNNVEEILAISVPERRWTIINSRILHSVEGISEGRRSYQIAMDVMPSLEKLKWPLFLRCTTHAS